MMQPFIALFQFLGFNVAWASAVAGGAGGWGLPGSLPAVALLGLHLFLSKGYRRAEAMLALAIVGFGVLLETGFAGAGLITFAGKPVFGVLPPLWVWALWLGFASLPNGSLGWLRGRFVLQMALGAAGGPLAYWTGDRMGAAVLADPRPATLLLIGLGWALAFPAIMLLAETLSPRPATS